MIVEVADAIDDHYTTAEEIANGVSFWYKK